MFSSLRSRMWLSYAMIIGANLFIIATILIVYLVRNPLVFRQTIAQLNLVKTVLMEESPDLSTLTSEEIKPILVNYDKLFHVRILIFDKNRNLLFDSRFGNSSAFPQNAIRAFRLTPILRDTNKQAWLVSVNQISGEKWLVLAVPRPKVQLLSILRDEIFPPFVFAGIIALFLSLLMAFALTRWIADPLQKMLTTASQFPVNEIDRLPLNGPREVKDLMRAFNQMLNRIQASQKSQRDFVANVSHELRTPLTSIQGFSQALLDGTATTPSEQHRAALVINDESERMKRLVSDLLVLARLDAGIADLQKTTLMPTQLLFNIIEKLKPQIINAGVNLDTNIPDLPEIIGDPDRLSQVFTNLLDNAIKFTPKDGKISIEALSVKNNIEIIIKDSGAGIPPEDVEHIFERFYQGDPSRKGGLDHGTGLGLAIVNDIVHAHNGKIEVSSNPGKGTTFVVTLPSSTMSSKQDSRR